MLVDACMLYEVHASGPVGVWPSSTPSERATRTVEISHPLQPLRPIQELNFFLQRLFHGVVWTVAAAASSLHDTNSFSSDLCSPAALACQSYNPISVPDDSESRNVHSHYARRV
jgi:hypothetical protein